MITDLINFMQATLETLAVFLFQVIYLGVLVFLCVGIVALLCLPLIIAYCKYLDRKEAAKKSPPASVTGHPGLPDRTAQSPPVAGDGGETG
ncbi:hypothetical protein [Pseudomonas sp. 8O]|uniref:hypothetical protein n=1 Tax=Pseudomonas sp. 8O TaxID=2653165 RepID=UPI0012F3C637|nr:hypothetical protein [Pseudomonas sp. 8O]VXB29280.1 conserved hypothetical protein [Pseudomonas sp. 8O]